MGHCRGQLLIILLVVGLLFLVEAWWMALPRTTERSYPRKSLSKVLSERRFLDYLASSARLCTGAPSSNPNDWNEFEHTLVANKRDRWFHVILVLQL
jgi:hypothetical protein